MPDLRLFLPKRLPMVLIAIAILLVTLSWVPLTMIAMSTQVKSEKPRIHLFQDMDNQAKFKAQSASPIFRDGRAMRQPVAGTVARGDLAGDAAYTLGYTVGKDGDEYVPQYVTELPDNIDADLLLLQHGKLKFETFCAPCHGISGHGNGPINEASLFLAQGDAELSWGTVWSPAANLHKLEADGRLTYGPELYPSGELYNVITHGKATMAGYGHAIPVGDRWSIVAYIHALQMSQNADAAQQAMDAVQPGPVRTADVAAEAATANP